MSKTVYVVTSGFYGENGVDAIFSTRELAQEYIDKVKAIQKTGEMVGGFIRRPRDRAMGG